MSQLFVSGGQSIGVSSIVLESIEGFKIGNLQQDAVSYSSVEWHSEIKNPVFPLPVPYPQTLSWSELRQGLGWASRQEWGCH